MTFFLLLVGLFALAHVPPLARALRAPARRDKMRVAVGLAFVIASLPHFFTPQAYLPMMPPFVPSPLTMIYVSGVAELLGGIGLLIPRSARLAAWGLVLLLIAIFPANLHVAMSGSNAAGLPSSPWYTWSRLPFQIVFIWWVLAATRDTRRDILRSRPWA